MFPTIATYCYVQCCLGHPPRGGTRGGSGGELRRLGFSAEWLRWVSQEPKWIGDRWNFEGGEEDG